MKKISNEELHRISAGEFKASEKKPIIVVLDNVRSMNNIGSIFRTCDAFRVEHLFLCGITACPPHREIQKTALDATESVEWKYFESTAGALNYLKSIGYTIIAIEQTNESQMLNQAELNADAKIALVFGNEINGVDDHCLPLCDYSIEIPQFGIKHSFNIAVSAGIVLWHFNLILANNSDK